MISSLDGDNVSAEIRSQEQTQRLDGVGYLGLAPGQTQLGELLVWLEHDHVWAEYHAGFLLLVVVDLYGGVVGDSECDDLGLVTFAGGAGWSSCRQNTEYITGFSTLRTTMELMGLVTATLGTMVRPPPLLPTT